MSTDSWRRYSRAFWIALAAFWIIELARALAAVRAGVPNSYHNQYPRQIALDVASLAIALVFIILEARRIPSGLRYVLVAVMFGCMIVSLIAAHRLAM